MPPLLHPHTNESYHLYELWSMKTLAAARDTVALGEKSEGKMISKWLRILRVQTPKDAFFQFKYDKWHSSPPLRQHHAPPHNPDTRMQSCVRRCVYVYVLVYCGESAHAHTSPPPLTRTHSFMCVTRLIHICDMTDVYMVHDTFLTHSSATSHAPLPSPTHIRNLCVGVCTCVCTCAVCESAYPLDPPPWHVTTGLFVSCFMKWSTEDVSDNLIEASTT